MPSSAIAAAKPIKDWAPDQFHTRHILICRLHAAGLRNKQIAQALELTESRVSIILNDPRASEYIREFAGELAEQLQGEVLTRIQAAAPQALSTVIDIMEDDEVHPSVRSRNAFDILDRAGYGAVEKHAHVVAPLSEKHMLRMEKALSESNAIDAAYTVVEDEDDDGDTDDGA